jgi:hypothetical protein
MLSVNSLIFRGKIKSPLIFFVISAVITVSSLFAQSPDASWETELARINKNYSSGNRWMEFTIKPENDAQLVKESAKIKVKLKNLYAPPAALKNLESIDIYLYKNEKNKNDEDVYVRQFWSSFKPTESFTKLMNIRLKQNEEYTFEIDLAQFKWLENSSNDIGGDDFSALPSGDYHIRMEIYCINENESNDSEKRNQSFISNQIAIKLKK